MLLEVFLDCLLGFADVNGEKNEAFGSEFIAHFVYESGFVGTKAAPSGPEFEQNHFAFDRTVVEFFAGGRCGGKVPGGCLVFGASGETESAYKQSGGEYSTEEDGSHAHGEKIAQIGEHGLDDRDWS